MSYELERKGPCREENLLWPSGGKPPPPGSTPVQAQRGQLEPPQHTQVALTEAWGSVCFWGPGKLPWLPGKQRRNPVFPSTAEQVKGTQRRLGVTQKWGFLSQPMLHIRLLKTRKYDAHGRLCWEHYRPSVNTQYYSHISSKLT